MKRLANALWGFAAFSVVVGLSYLFYFQTFLGPVIERYCAHWALAHASGEALETAVGPRGTVLHFSNSSWIAIRYDDSHIAPWELAVALDSDGQWYESTEHFCRALNLAPIFEQMARESGGPLPLPPDPPTNYFDWMQLLMASPDLPAARHHMARYFHPPK